MPHEVAALVYVVVGLVVIERLPIAYSREALLLAHSTSTLLIFAMAVTLSYLRARGDRGFWKREVLDITRCCAALLVVFSTSFVGKSFIYLINSRVWDGQLMAIDQEIHFGHSPTIFFATLFQNDLFLRLLDIYYSQLYFVLFVTVPALLLAYSDRMQRVRFTAALVLLWMGGNLLYILLPSWGPVFTAPALVEGPLQSMPATVWVQSRLFGEISSLVHSPLAPRVARFGGVAAFPSLHVAVVTLFALAGRKLLHGKFAIAVVAVLLMQVGSVVTGYHFMIDGYAGALLAIAAWQVARVSSNGFGGPEVN